MYRNILVPIAPFHPNKTQEAINLAKTLRSEGGTITLATIIEPIPGFVDQYLPSDHIERNQKQLEISLQKDAEGISNVRTIVIDSHKTAGPALVEHATKHQCDLIIIASHRPGLQDYFLGSTAARVVRHAPCAVHVVR